MAPTICAAASNDCTWYLWTATDTTVTNFTPSVWPLWCTQGTAASNATVWNVWVDQTGMPGPVIVSGQGWRQPTPTAEELEERRRADEGGRRAIEAAKTRARELLLDALTETQQAEFEQDGHFTVVTRDGVRAYRLKPGSPPIRTRGEDGRRWSYCIHPRESYPAEDTALALKLLLETDEDEFLR